MSARQANLQVDSADPLVGIELNLPTPLQVRA
jgi:hypothetical protein